MTKQEQIIEKLASDFKQNPDYLALLVTGSVARGEAGENSDIDLLQISKTEQPFKEFTIDGILVEVKTHTKSEFVDKMKAKPMNVYQWLDARFIMGDKNIADEIILAAKSVYQDYKPDPDEIKAVKKWLESTKLKINESINRGDDLSVGFYVSNILWKIVEGLYLVNNKPLPPSTTAFRRITELEKLPQDFTGQWQDILTGDLDKRTRVTIALIDFVLNLGY